MRKEKERRERGNEKVCIEGGQADGQRGRGKMKGEKGEVWELDKEK